MNDPEFLSWVASYKLTPFKGPCHGRAQSRLILSCRQLREDSKWLGTLPSQRLCGDLALLPVEEVIYPTVLSRTDCRAPEGWQTGQAHSIAESVFLPSESEKGHATCFG